MREKAVKPEKTKEAARAASPVLTRRVARKADGARTASPLALQRAHGGRQVMRASSSSASVSGVTTLRRKCSCGEKSGGAGGCSSCREETLGKRRRAGAEANRASAESARDIPQSVDETLRAPGRALDPTTREEMESRFGLDFGGVRVHTDTRAAESARAVDALAYTVGSNIVFDSGRFAPETQEGRRLLAHELAHVAQGMSGAFAEAGVLPENHPAEIEAEQVAQAVTSSHALSQNVAAPQQAGAPQTTSAGGALLRQAAAPARKGPQTFAGSAVTDFERTYGKEIYRELPDAAKAYIQAGNLSLGFSSGFMEAARKGVPPDAFQTLKAELTTPKGAIMFNLGAGAGVPVGAAKDLWDNIEGLWQLAKTIVKYTSAFYWLDRALDEAGQWAADPEGMRRKKQQEWEHAKEIYEGIQEFVRQLQRDPAFLVEYGEELGFHAGGETTRWFTEKFMTMSPFDKGMVIGEVAGFIVMEVVLFFCGPEVWVAKGAALAGRLARGSKFAMRILEMLRRVPGLGSLIARRAGAVGELAGDVGRVGGKLEGAAQDVSKATRAAEETRAAEKLAPTEGLHAPAEKPPAASAPMAERPPAAPTAQAPAPAAPAPTPAPPTPAAPPAAATATAAREAEVVKGINRETLDMLKRQPDMLKGLIEHPVAAEALKFCNSPCFPKMTERQIARLDRAIERVRSGGGKINMAELKRFLYESRSDINAAIRKIEASADEGIKIAKEAEKAAKFRQAEDAFEAAEAARRPHLDPDSLGEQVRKDIAETQQKGVGEKYGYEEKQRQRSEGVDEPKAPEAPQAIQPAVQASIKVSHDTAVARGSIEAVKDGLKPVPWDNFYALQGNYGHGLDDVMETAAGVPVIIEYKGGSSPLGKSQLKPSWVQKKIEELRKIKDPMGNRLCDALKSGLLTSRVYRTVINEHGVANTVMEKLIPYDPANC